MKDSKENKLKMVRKFQQKTDKASNMNCREEERKENRTPTYRG